MNGIYIYGAGGYGRAALEKFFVNDSIHFIIGIIDNSPSLSGQELYGITIRSYDETISHIEESDTVLICVELETSISIGKQLRSDGIHRFLYWAYEQYEDISRVVAISQSSDGYEILAHTLQNELDTAIYQRDYLLQHIDPKDLKPATGIIRNRQLQLIELARECLAGIYAENIHPFLMGGNLLGYVRHNGFIPWDDDLDFAVMRDDYIRLKKYCKENYYYSMYNGPFNNDTAQLIWLKRELDNHEEEICALERPMLFRLCRKSKAGEYLLIDFFPMDEYDENVSFDEYILSRISLRKYLSDAKTVNDYTIAIERIRKADMKYQKVGGRNIHWGIECRGSYYLDTYHSFLDRNDLFPLQMINFEGLCCECPNNLIESLNYQFTEYESIPSNFALHFSADVFKTITI